MTGLLCLQGGREFTRDCRPMDATVLERSGAGSSDRPVAVLAGAARVGHDHDGAIERARQHYEGLGAHVVAVPDPRLDVNGALRALDDVVGLLVLPGGSPSSLIDVLLGSTQSIGHRVVELHRAGMSISGASAGAMVACELCILPDESRRRRVAVAHGLGLAEGIALPHWSAGAARWSLPDELDLWGLPECGGVLIEGTACEAVGRGEPAFRPAGHEWSPVVRAVAA